MRLRVKLLPLSPSPLSTRICKCRVSPARFTETLRPNLIWLDLFPRFMQLSYLDRFFSDERHIRLKVEIAKTNGSWAKVSNNSQTTSTTSLKFIGQTRAYAYIHWSCAGVKNQANKAVARDEKFISASRLDLESQQFAMHHQPGRYRNFLARRRRQ